MKTNTTHKIVLNFITKIKKHSTEPVLNCSSGTITVPSNRQNRSIGRPSQSVLKTSLN